jgi:hypothetical protein
MVNVWTEVKCEKCVSSTDPSFSVKDARRRII